MFNIFKHSKIDLIDVFSIFVKNLLIKIDLFNFYIVYLYLMVIWIIGLSGSGKSFYAKQIKKKISNSIIVDGDEVRKYITTKLGYSSKDRKENSLMIIT